MERESAVYARLQSAMRHPEKPLHTHPDSASLHQGYALRSRPMIRITDRISIDEAELAESFIRASGPGGQNVNKLATAVQLRFDVRHSPSLRHDVRMSLAAP